MQQVLDALRRRQPQKAGAWMLLGAISLASGCTHTQGSKHLSSGSYAATRRAVEAIERAGEYRNAKDTIFNPKFEEARKAMEDVEHEIGNETSDAYAATQVRVCVEDLREYRSNFDSRETVSRPIQEQLKGVKATEIKDASEVMAADNQDFDDCIKTAKSYF